MSADIEVSKILTVLNCIQHLFGVFSATVTQLLAWQFAVVVDRL